MGRSRTKFCTGCEEDKPLTSFTKLTKGYRWVCKSCYQDYNIARRRGLTLQEYKAQPKHCENTACRATVSGKNKGRLHADHDHESGLFRGILCANCNIALGCVKDDPEILRGLVEYLESRQ